MQYGITGGGNDGAAFVPYGAVDIALGWPLRYSHSPAEVIDTRDVDSLARIIPPSRDRGSQDDLSWTPAHAGLRSHVCYNPRP